MASERFYTHCSCVANNIFYRGVENGERVVLKIPYKPSLFLPSNKPSKYRTIDGKSVSKLEFDSIKDAKEFIQKYAGIDNFTYYGNTKFQYVYLSDEYPNPVDYDLEKIVVANIDIEAVSPDGFPNIEEPSVPVVAISVKAGNKIYVFGCGSYQTERKDIYYFKCKDEKDLLEKFISKWAELAPDIVTGWNCRFFDLPYLVGRINRVLGENSARELSSFKYISTMMANYKGKPHQVIDLVGTAVLDYIELYRKFQARQESEKLNYIAYVELGEQKLAYEEYGTLFNLYTQNFQKFIEYNIRDVELVDRLEAKLKLIEMCVAIAYDARVNYSDVFTQVRMWDSIIFNHLRHKNIVVPKVDDKDKDTQYAGAYVKEVVPGMYKWIVSYDLNSLYPNLIAQFNISPETLLPTCHRQTTVKDLLSQATDTSDLEDRNMCMAANGHCFTNEKQGFLPEILMRMYEDRKLYKKKMIEAQKELERVKEELTRRKQ